MKRLAIPLSVSLVMLVGCQSDTPPESSNEVENQEPIVSPEEEEQMSSYKDNVNQTKYENITVSVQDAYDLFLDKYPNAKINEIELEQKDQTFEYEIEGHDGTTQYEMEIDALTNEIISAEQEREDDETGELTKADLDKVDSYVSQALDDAGEDFWVEEWELEAKSDSKQFELKLKTDRGDKSKYKYDLDSGELIKMN